MRSPTLVAMGLPISPYNLSFFLDCFHMRGGVSHLGGFPGQPCRVTRLDEVNNIFDYIRKYKNPKLKKPLSSKIRRMEDLIC